MKYYLAVDIGASSGRLMLSYLQDGIMKLEEVHRFPNGMKEKRSQMLGHQGAFLGDYHGNEKVR